jgi:hypothetical protein
LPADPAAVFAAVSDLATYPSWLGIVVSATATATAAGEDAWDVEIGARLGPLRRTKRLRMVRTECVPASRVRFERVELDGREHGSWTLAAEVVPGAGTTALTMDLAYAGSKWLPGLDLVLREEVRRAGGRLQRLLDEGERAGGDT